MKLQGSVGLPQKILFFWKPVRVNDLNNVLYGIQPAEQLLVQILQITSARIVRLAAHQNLHNYSCRTPTNQAIVKHLWELSHDEGCRSNTPMNIRKTHFNHSYFPFPPQQQSTSDSSPLGPDPLTHQGCMTQICLSTTPSLVQIMAWHLIGAKPLSEPMLA